MTELASPAVVISTLNAGLPDTFDTARGWASQAVQSPTRDGEGVALGRGWPADDVGSVSDSVEALPEELADPLVLAALAGSRLATLKVLAVAAGVAATGGVAFAAVSIREH